MSESDDYPEWEEEDLSNIESEPYNQEDDEESNGMDALQKSLFENRVIRTFVKNAFEFGGTDTLLEVLTQVEHKMGWRTEIIADKNALDDYMFYRHQTFDEQIWSHYANSDQYRELTQKVALMSERAMSDFVEAYSSSESTRKVFRKKLRDLAWFFVKKFS